jgi:hypothetical protein
MKLIAALISNWKILCPAKETSELEQKLRKLKCIAEQLARLAD